MQAEPGDKLTPKPIHLVLPYPPSCNRQWRNFRGKTVLAKAVKDFRDEVAIIALVQRIVPLEGELTLTIDVYRPRKSGDLSNRIKQAEDALIGLAFRDDSQVVHLEASRYDDKANPRIEVFISQATNNSLNNKSLNKETPA